MSSPKVRPSVKILRNSVAGDPAVKQRFARESEVQARVRHPNVAALLATGVTQTEQPYLVVELLRGKNLRGMLKEEGRVGPRRAASYAWQMLQGLSAVHGAGILHRDLKPANIMLEPSPGPVTEADLAKYLDAQMAVREATQLDLEVAAADLDQAWEKAGGAALAARLGAVGIDA